MYTDVVIFYLNYDYVMELRIFSVLLNTYFNQNDRATLYSNGFLNVYHVYIFFYL